MSLTFYIISSSVVFLFSGLMAMAGLGAAFLFVPFFYYLGVPLREAASTALLLNAVSLSVATVNYWRGRLIDWPIAIPMLVTAVTFSPIGARTTPFVNQQLLLGLFAGFLVFAGAMMLLHKPKVRAEQTSRGREIATGSGVGAVAGFIGGLLGVGGGNMIVPALNWLGRDAKVAAGTCAVVVVFSSLSGFLGHVSLGGLDPVFVGVMALMAAMGSLAGSQLMKNKISSAQLKKIIGIVLWLIAAKMLFDLVRKLI